MPAGGKREGAGRKPKARPGLFISVYATPETLDAIDRALGETPAPTDDDRREFMRQAYHAGLALKLQEPPRSTIGA